MVPLTIQPGATKVGEGITVGEYELIFKGNEWSNNPNARPGMPIVAKLVDGSYAMVIENSCEQIYMPELGSFDEKGYNLVIQIAYSHDGHTWTWPKTIIRPERKAGTRNGAEVLFKTTVPFISILSDGRAVLSCSTDESYEGGWPSDSSHYKQLKGWVTTEVLTYGKEIKCWGNGTTQSDNSDLIKLDIYNYSRGEYCVWGSVCYVNGRLFFGGVQGINGEGKNASTSSIWTLLMEIDEDKLPKTVN